MSLVRLVYYSAVVGGIAAFVGWLTSELLFSASLRSASVGFLGVAVIGGLVGAAIGVAINLVAGMANAQWKQLVLRALPGLIGGGIGGALGGLMGNVLFVFLGLPRPLGWLMMGLGIGVVDGVYERSKSKIRNGLIGGAMGGLVGGLLFDFIPWMLENSLGLASGTGMSSRATGFVILGISIGALIGLAQVVLREGWLTVLDGYRTGRQLILSQEVTVLGRAEYVPLPFLGPMNKDLEAEHLKIIRQPSGSFVLEDNHSRLGTLLNYQPVKGPVLLTDGDTIKLGANSVRFNQRQRKSGEQLPAAALSESQGQVVPGPPPPRVRKKTGAPAKPTAAPQAPAAQTPPPPEPKAAPPGKPSPPRTVRPGGGPPPPRPPRRKS